MSRFSWKRISSGCNPRRARFRPKLRHILTPYCCLLPNLNKQFKFPGSLLPKMSDECPDRETGKNPCF
ncbi:unknown protein [Microcystis aeruginosa NIES-843]|uniref:Uncharacterized protein n=1 Tax=Microcystis aeruginosa (strain NIES-843 / IAM M-2473) TaxID=449447 RepID=B0JY79_MICAN|nr:unknown protein [Microcystis aeruginosa NIES-843]